VAIAVLRDGTIRGGTSFFYFVGTYSCSDGKWKGEMTNQEHSQAPVTRPMAGRVVSIGFSGTYTDEGAEAGGTPLVGKRSIRYNAIFRLQREQDPKSPFVFTSERGAPFGTAGFARMVERAGVEAKLGFKAHPHMLRHACGFALASKGHDTRALQACGGEQFPLAARCMRISDTPLPSHAGTARQTQVFLRWVTHPALPRGAALHLLLHLPGWRLTPTGLFQSVTSIPKNSPSCRSSRRKPSYCCASDPERGRGRGKHGYG
jgi:hypothetical protein